MHRLADLREILRYVPAVPGQGLRDRDRRRPIVEDANFRNLLLDISLISAACASAWALVHGAGLQIENLAAATGASPQQQSTATGVTDHAHACSLP